jgi:protein ImuA
VHEFVTPRLEDSAATSGFIAALLGSLLNSSGTLLWISSSRTLFPPALKSFGVQPERCIFLDLQKEKDVLWAMDEALKCGALAAVVGEVKEMSFTASRRLQLAVEESRVTGFVLRHHTQKLNPTACVSRWMITSRPSEYIDGLPGVGFPRWKIELLRIKNGKPGAWDIQWMNGKFHPVYNSPSLYHQQSAVNPTSAPLQAQASLYEDQFKDTAYGSTFNAALASAGKG